MKLSPDEIRGHIAMLAFSGLVAGSFSLGTRIANEIDPQAITSLRFVLASIVMGFVAWLQGELKPSYARAPWRYFLLGGLFTFYFVMMFEGLKSATPVSAAAVFTMMPLMSAGFGYLLLRQVMTRRMALALAIAVMGALVVIFRGDVTAMWTLDIGRGEAIYFVGCIAHALYTPLSRSLNRGEGAAVFTFGMLVGGSLPLVILSLPQITTTSWLLLSPLAWFTVAYITLISTAVGFFLLQFAALRLPSAKVMAYTYLTPAWVLLWEVGFGSGFPSLSVIMGILATCVALAMLLRKEDPATTGKHLN